jgi:ribosomal protein S18 acetylase RimI-like enzyme
MILSFLRAFKKRKGGDFREAFRGNEGNMLDKSGVEVFDFSRRSFPELAALTHAYFTELSPFDDSITFAEGWEQHYRQTIESAMMSPHFFLRGVRVNGRTAGFIMFGFRDEPMWQKRRRGYLSNIYVIPSERRKGLGQFMVEGALQTMRQMDVAVVELDVYGGNEAGERFWRAMGFEFFKQHMRMKFT